ncbi:DUF4340 domain-containing protein [bacterium]|nr:DUF4340 domain-containing protein [bacterium]
MKVRTISILLVTFIILAVVYYCDYRARVERQTAEVLETLVLPFPAGEVLRIEIRRPDGATMAFEKREGQWWLTAPVQEPADQRVIEEGILPALAKARKFGGFPVQADDLANYGLENKALRVRVEPETGEAVELSLGNETPVQGEGYLLQPDRPGYVHVTQWDVRQALDRALLDFRDKRVFTFDVLETPAFQVTRPGRDVLFARDVSGNWQVQTPDWPRQALRADGNQVRDLLQSLQAMEPLAEDADLITSPALLVQIRVPDRQEEVLVQFEAVRSGESITTGTPSTYIARVAGRPLLYKATPATVETFTKPISDYYDRFLLSLAPRDVRAIDYEWRIGSQQEKVSLQRVGDDRWSLAGLPGRELSENRIFEYLVICLSQQVETYTPDPSATDTLAVGLGEPMIRVHLTSENEQSEGFELGGPVPGKVLEFYARRIETPPSNRIFSVALSNDMLNALIRRASWFYDRSVLEFDPEAVDTILLVSHRDPPTTLSLVRDEIGDPPVWRGQVNFNPAKMVPGHTVGLFLDILRGLEYAERRTSISDELLEESGLKSPLASIHVYDDEGEELGVLHLPLIGRSAEERKQALIEGPNMQYYYIDMTMLANLSKALDQIVGRLR